MISCLSYMINCVLYGALAFLQLLGPLVIAYAGYRFVKWEVEREGEER